MQNIKKRGDRLHLSNCNNILQTIVNRKMYMVFILFIFIGINCTLNIKKIHYIKIDEVQPYLAQLICSTEIQSSTADIFFNVQKSSRTDCKDTKHELLDCLTEGKEKG